MSLVNETDLRKLKGKEIPVIRHGAKKDTGSWKSVRPVCDKKKCTKCQTCWLVCPDTAIKMGKDGKPVFDYSICKGCLTCVVNCPAKALFAQKEVHK